MNRRPEGFALILVIWSLVLLASLATGFSYAVRHEIRTAADMASVARAEAAATAALHTTVLALGDTSNTNRWLPDSGAHGIDWPGADIKVRVQSEGGRIDINHAPTELLSGLLSQFVTPDKAQALADALIDRREASRESPVPQIGRRPGSRANRSFLPANAAFQSIYELGQVPGFDHLLLEKVMPFLTVYSRRPRINAASADLVTLMSVPGIDRDQASSFIAQREQSLAESGKVDLSALRNGRQYLDTRPSEKLLSVDIDVRLDQGLRRREHAVIHLDRSRGYTLLVRETRPVEASPGGPPG